MAERLLSPSGVGAASAGAVWPAGLTRALIRRDLPPERAYLAWELARLAEVPDHRDRQAVLYLVLAVLTAEDEGSTRLPLEPPEVLDRSLSRLGASPEDVERVRLLLAPPEGPGPAPVVGPPDTRRPLICDGRWVALHRCLSEEEEVAARLAGLLKAPGTRPPEALEDALTGSEPTLSPEQREAVRSALGRGMALIAGGPGTGKTVVVGAVVRAAVQIGTPAPERIALAAPTGRAARRLDQAVTEILGEGRAGVAPATTLHRLLEASRTGDRFGRHRRRPLDSYLVVVDEASMVDLRLFRALLRALPEDGRLVLVGDDGQLPPVAAGAVFQDLVARPEVPTVSLGRSFRLRGPAGTTGRLARVAERIRAGRLVGDDLLPVRRAAGDLSFSGPELLETEPGEGLGGFLEVWRRRVLALEALLPRLQRDYRFREGRPASEEVSELEDLFARHAAAQILCATRSDPGPASVAAVNEWLRQDLLALTLPSLRPSTGGGEVFLPGEPVIFLRNDPELGLSNGDRGLVLRATDTPGAGSEGLRAVFRLAPGDLVALPLAALRGRLERAWATTVHKAQGSELDVVALVLPGRDLEIMTRELVYTAVTRARRSVVVVGSRTGWRVATTRRPERYSGVGEALGEAMAEGSGGSSSR